jgi:diadenosine tetraphosphate (Ap4A) HIT family hydrolase
MESPGTHGCYVCRQTAQPVVPPRESVWSEPGWRVAHAFNSSLPGWLVVVPTRHVDSLADLTVDESGAMGRLLRNASLALRSVTNCPKTYVMLFAEAEGFAHLHLHVVPRMEDQPGDRRGPAVFAYLEEEALNDQERDAVALRLRSAWPEVG